MNGVSFEKAKVSDALRIAILLKTVYIQTYGVEGISFEFANFITKKFDPEVIAQTIKESPNQFVVAAMNGNPVGVAETIFNGLCPIRNKPVAELSKLYVLERFYGQGIGYKLLKEAESIVRNQGGKDLNLEVYIKNPRAIAFYERQGYKVIGRVDFPMETNTYENLVLHKVLG